ncbi:MAG: sel1 repeat family protein [Tannerella sp.]|jgi:TPR repeat protein|nr:sel1 repeat family protein [Tannerella sp.]
MWGETKKNKEEKQLSIQELNESVKLLASIFMNDSPPDYERAFTQYMLAAKEGNDVDSQYNVASMYATGQGTEKNYLLAVYWFKKAADQGDEKAGTMLKKATLDYFNEHIEDWSPEGIFNAITDYYTQIYCYNKEDAIASAVDLIESIAVYYYKDKQNYVRALKCFRAMAEFGGSDSAMQNMGICYMRGYGTERNDLTALYWFDKAAGYKNEQAKENRDAIFRAYLFETGVLQSKELFELLASWCEQGINGIPVDIEKSNYWNDISDKL